MSQECLFAKQNLFELIERSKREVVQKVQAQEKDYLLNVSETDICEHLFSMLRLDVPVLLRSKMYALEPEEVDVDVSHEQWRVALDLSKPFYVKGTSVTVVIPFEGDKELFDYRPSTFSTHVPLGSVVGQELRLLYTQTKHDPDSFRRAVEGDLTAIESYLQWVRTDVERYNDQLPQLVEKAIRERKARLLAAEGLVSSLGIPISRRSEANLTFRPPEIRRKPVIRQPKVAPGPFEPEPALDMAEYDHILEIVRSMVLVMERSPRAFASMREEDLRTHILVQLNGHYEGLATGETFNYQGKTDILIRYNDRNVFVAECMFWDGPKSLLGKLHQLLGYASWRDTKTAIVLFSRKGDFSAVLDKVCETVPQHPCYKRQSDKRGETDFRYVFHHPSDTNREVFVTILAFDVPSQ